MNVVPGLECTELNSEHSGDKDFVYITDAVT